MTTAEEQNNSAGATEDALTRWLSLASQIQLPMLPITGKQLRRLVADENVSLNALTPVLSKDPVATLMLMRAANKIAHKSSTQSTQNPTAPLTKQIITVEHCVGVIGFDRLKALISAAPVLQTAIDQTSYVNYAGSLMRSLHAAFQARDWARLRGHHQPEHIFLSALLYGAPHWALWHAAPAEMKIIEHLKVNEKIPASEAELAVLGTTKPLLARALAQAWQLPLDVQAAYDGQKTPNIKTLLKAGQCAQKGQLGTLPNIDPQGRPTNTSATLVQLANWLAQEADITWESRQMQRCTAVIAAFLNKPFQHISVRLKQQALEVSRAYCFPGVQTPGGRLLLPRKTLRRRKLTPEKVQALVAKLMDNKEALAQDGPATAPAAQSIQNLVSQISKPKPPTPNTRQPTNQAQQDQTPEREKQTHTTAKRQAPVDLIDAQLFKKIILRLKQQPQSFADTNSVLQLAGHGLVAGLGLGRVLILQPEKGTQTLRVTDAFGQDLESLNNLTVPIQRSDLFAKLLEKPAALRVDQSANSNIMTLIPAAFKQATNSAGNFFTTSLFNEKNPIAIIYADEGDSGEPIRESRYQYFKALCKAAGYCLVNLS